MERVKKTVLLIVLLVLICAIAFLICWYVTHPAKEAAPEPTPEPTPTPVVVIQEVEKEVQVEAEITAEEIKSGLNDMGELTTAKYVFTGIAKAEKPPLSVGNWELGITSAHCYASYDGTVVAGIDFGAIGVEKDAESKTVTVRLPAATILAVNIDHESFQLIDEKQSVFAHISPEDYNLSVVNLESETRERTVALGLLETADENARTIIERFVKGLAGTEYTVSFEPAD